MAGKANTSKTKYSQGGSDVFVLHVYGDKAKQLEPGEHRIHFPGGYIGVTRTTENKYWVHIGIHKEFDGAEEHLPGRLSNARLDITDKSVNEADLGDLNNPKLYHLAILVETVKEFLNEPGRKFQHIK